MKKLILLFILFILSTGCSFLSMWDGRDCTYSEKDGLYYDWRELPEKKVPCDSLNKKIEREKKKIEKEKRKLEKDGK